MRAFKGVLIGIFTGFLNGFFGSGGGTVAVPAMRRLLKVPTIRAHATAIAVMLPLSAVSAFIYARGYKSDAIVLAIVVICGCAGAFIGARLLKKTPPKLLRKLFGAFLAAAALRMIF